MIRAIALGGEETDAGPRFTSIPVPAPGAEGGDAEPSEEHPASTGLAGAVVAELEQIRRLEAVQATRRTGWEVETSTGSTVVLAASMGEGAGESTVLELARLFHELGERDLACRVTLSAVLLFPRHAGGGQVTTPEGTVPPASNKDRAISADDVLLFDEGCTLLHEVNADGLLVPTGGEQVDVVGNWLTLWATTPLQAGLDRMPPGEAGRYLDTFGLAAWEFPLAPLWAYLARRWQWEILGRLLAPAGGEQRAAVAFMEQHGKAGAPWPQDAPLHFRVTSDAWATPALDLVHTLRSEIDKTVEAEWARLDAMTAQGEEERGAACRDTRDALAAEVDALLDGAGLGTAETFLAGLESEARGRTLRLEREARRCRTRAQELAGRADESGAALDDLAGRFPPLQLRTLVGLALRPWRLLHLWLLYRDIGRRAGTYLAYRQSQWLLQAEAHEREWQAARTTALGQAASEEQEVIAQLRARLEPLRNRLAPDRALQQRLDRQLEAAALPGGLADHFYRQVTGDGGPSPLGLLALYGPLSRWVREEWEVETLGLVLAEHAQEQFAFLAGVRLDELLAHTHSGAELRRRLAALIDAAAPWWACDEPALSGEERAHLCRLVMIGLPDADSSPLVDLLPDRPHAGIPSCFSTGDRHQVVVAQVIQGLPPTALAAPTGPPPRAPHVVSEPGDGSPVPRHRAGAVDTGSMAAQQLDPEEE